MEKVLLLPLGKIEERVLVSLQSKLSKIFNLKVEIKESLPLPHYAYNPKRKQYYSSIILEDIKKRTKIKASERVLAVIDLDLYVPELNFVFGEADIKGRVCIISLSRLRQEWYNLPKDEDLFIQRVIKEAVHELGHTYGLRHCDNFRCVMFFSNSLLDTDKKSFYFCKRCQRGL
jgi:archaemetzincin